jgi:hypothetical protein
MNTKPTHNEEMKRQTLRRIAAREELEELYEQGKVAKKMGYKDGRWVELYRRIK